MISIAMRFFTWLNNRNKKPLMPVPSVVKSYSQYGEDLVIDAILGCKERGFYVDVGANDPTLLNNTKRFYDRGWCGINVESHVFKYHDLWKARPRDTNLNAGVGALKEDVPFYIVSADTLSSFSKEDAERNCRMFGERIVSVDLVDVIPLTNIMARHTEVDFLTIDVEGQELEVLESNDWDLYRPKVVSTEVNSNGIEIQKFLKDCNYILVYENRANGIFVDTEAAL